MATNIMSSAINLESLLPTLPPKLQQMLQHSLQFNYVASRGSTAWHGLGCLFYLLLLLPLPLSLQQVLLLLLLLLPVHTSLHILRHFIEPMLCARLAGWLAAGCLVGTFKLLFWLERGIGNSISSHSQPSIRSQRCACSSLPLLSVFLDNIKGKNNNSNNNLPLLVCWPSTWRSSNLFFARGVGNEQFCKTLFMLLPPSLGAKQQKLI